MANVIIQDERRQADIEYVAKKYGIDTQQPGNERSCRSNCGQKP